MGGSKIFMLTVQNIVGHHGCGQNIYFLSNCLKHSKITLNCIRLGNDALEFNRNYCMLRDQNQIFNDTINVFDDVIILSFHYFISIFELFFIAYLLFCLSSNLAASFKMYLHMLERKKEKRTVRSEFLKINFAYHIFSCLAVLKK